MNTWDQINEIGAALGANFEARKKWKQRRCVPHRWRLPIINEGAKRGILIDQAAFDLPSNDNPDVQVAV